MSEPCTIVLFVSFRTFGIPSGKPKAREIDCEARITKKMPKTPSFYVADVYGDSTRQEPAR
jgi:hypothetical protein